MTLAPVRLAGTMLQRLRALRAARGGVALLEFALMMPVFVMLCVGGTELTHYTTTKMRISQVALQIADNAARMGSGSVLAAKTVTESDVNDLFAGAQIEAGGLDLKTNGRVILSDLEPTTNPNTADTYKIGWQRCYGAKTTHASTFGTANQANVTTKNAAGQSTTENGMGPAGRPTKAQDGNATMFVEVYYVYKPVISLGWVPTTTFTEIASMSVRDRRDLTTGPTAVSGVTASTC